MAFYAGRKKLCGVMNSADASHTIIISKDNVVVAGAYLKVTKHQCFDDDDDDGGGVIDGGQTIQEIMDGCENFCNDDGDTFETTPRAKGKKSKAKKRRGLGRRSFLRKRSSTDLM